MITAGSLTALAAVFVTAPALPGIAARTRALLTGRHGPPVLQLYADLGKLLRKSAVYSTTTTWVFRAAPAVLVGALLAAAMLLPLDGRAAAAPFPGDLLVFAGLLALGRWALLLAALDTGSSFEGMGASREAAFAALAEPALFLALLALVLATGRLSLSGMLGPALARAWPGAAPVVMLVGVSLFVVMLAECARGPVDDPTTHLELTMIHEAMILDHGGPDLAVLLYASALKMALLGALVVTVVVPRAALGPAAATVVLVGGLAVAAVAVGVVESVMARLRLDRVPQLLAAASALAILGLALVVR